MEPLNPASAGVKSALNVLPERIPAETGALPLATQATVSKSNGITFVTVNEPKAVSSMSLFVKAGSRYEDESSAGSANFLKRLAFRSTEKKYYYPLVLDVDKAGVEFSSSASREYVSYNLTGLRSDVPLMAETLGAVYQPRLEEWEIDAVRAEVLAEVESHASCGRTTLLDAVHREAFRDQGLAHAPNAAAFEAENLTPAALRQYVNTHYTADRMIVVANGVNADELLEQVGAFAPYDVKGVINNALGPGVEGYFPILAGSKTVHAHASAYKGGAEVRLPAAGPTQLIVAAEGVSASAGLPSQIAAAVLQTILGGGASNLRSILPSLKQSRLAKSISASNGWFNYAESFNLSYADTGLFGVFAQAEAGNAAALGESIAKQFQTLGAVSDAEVERAKLQLKANLFSSFAADPFALAEFYASQVSSSGAALTPSQFAQQIDQVDTASVVAVAKKIASSKLTVAALGDIKGLPKF